MDITYQTNYWFGFPESNSDIIINLTHWQYWWWFWFTYLLCLYYFIFLRLIRNRLLKFHPKIVTSYRAHGKWGDFIICILPISWCINILSNSNFILRMLEWQTESNLFTVRIRGKQWYWVYKIEVKTLFNVDQLSKNVGHNKWYIFNTNDSENNSNYLNIMQIKDTNKWLGEYLDAYYNDLSHNKSHNAQYLNFTNDVIVRNNNTSNKSIFNNLNRYNSNINNLIFFRNTSYIENFKYINFFLKKSNILNLDTPKINLSTHKIFNFNNFFTEDMDRYTRFNYFSKINFFKINFLKNNFLSQFNVNNNNFMLEKNLPENVYLVIKQKRYLPVNKTTFFNNKSFIFNNASYFTLLSTNRSHTKFASKALRNKSLNFNNIHYKRLLRTKRILVLPMNTNITLITNSFDVVHSWYIPGLGIKLDCVPGRSTHHTINIDHSGFYYGQCAEICGRHHHHMPIRVCALPFEHFLIWWYHFGLPYFNATKQNRKLTVKSGIKQYNW